MTSRDLIRPLARRFNWMANRIIPECTIDGGIADLLVITKAGYLTEIEIKVRLSDWKADLLKRKWYIERPHISRFFYAAPYDLASNPPEGLPEGAGILGISGAGQHIRMVGVHVLRPAKRKRTTKLTRLEILELSDCMYYRWWHTKFRDIASPLFEKEENAAKID